MDDSSSNNNSTDEGLSLQDSISRFTVICQGCSQKMIFNKSVLYAVKYPDRPGGTILVESPERLAQRPEVQAATRSTKALLDAYKLNKGSSLPTVKTLSQSTRLSKNIPNLKRHDSSQVFSQSVRKFNKVHTKTLASPFRLAPAASNIGLSFSSTVSFRLKSAAAAAVAATASSASTASYEDSGRNSSAFEFPEEPLSMEAMLSLLDENSLSCSQPVLHPLCNRCAETRSLAIDSEIRHLQEEITRYKKVFTAPLSPLPPAADEEFSWLSCPLQEDEDKLDSELAQCLEEEKRLKDELLLVSRKRQTVKQRAIALKQSEKRLRELEKKYWKNYNAQRNLTTEQAVQMRDQFSTLRWKTRRLDLLCHSTVLEDAFRIGHDGFLGTVNGMRLGRLPSVPVDWAEINCAWGYVALLLNGIAKALPGIQFNTSLVLVGNTSYVLSSDRGMLNLFNDGSKLFGTRRLDDAVSELLKVVMRMSEYCSRYDKNFFFPYVIGSDKVGKFPVRYQAKDDVGWSEAMKSLLTDIKFIVSWVVPKMNTKIQIK